MRLALIFAVIAAACLASSEAFATSPGKAKISKVTLLDAPGQRLLRAHRAAVEDEDDSAERGLSAKDYAAPAKYGDDLGIDVAKATRNTAYLNEVAEQYQKYKDFLNQLIQSRKTKRSSMISYERRG
ncbi:secreted RxLR effector peptide protein, putative [Phytophthora infestans T30-4]|uniref:RxLR effector protein n=2 Tax=Phytophthora infestans TaxID=4787 RepID=D0NCP5_PHYIT|nr:secreted RxLR effector peptide protein, putative [Phytophthora infestans T30-4]EEY55759.1 secreted RxLR effector peptide protein, putative [Phytophthora infestans T30-4]KAF4030610.1 hypothetical protein GN244_ATG17586 [Phytophthora infestans]KAF4139612.1 hypothetical protein GN958_ATG11097 [Phytophthora infestans]|eukprot:XP_002903335.1 secreted RxLR effector peptide protein, putative [Phytophthora infestans T30-4]